MVRLPNHSTTSGDPRKPVLDVARGVLIIGECTAAGATLEQITEIFAASGFQLLLLADLDLDR